MSSLRRSNLTVIEKRLNQIKTRFVITIVILATVSVATLAVSLYVTNAISISKDISSQKIESLTKNYPEVKKYLEQQKQSEAHFVKLANLVKSDQQQLLANALIYTVVPILLIVGVISFIVARRLLRPIKESFESQEQFLQDAAHELRNPLAALYAVAQEAKARPKNRNSNEIMDTIERQVKQVVQLNEDLLALEKAKMTIPEISVHNISDLAYDVVDGLTFKARTLHIDIKTDISPDIHALIRDEDWVCICNNLIDNAIKYSKPRGKVTVTLQKYKKRAVLTVTDSGIGIPHSEIKKIGNRFYRATNIGRVVGTGLGLAIVNQTLARYKGSLKIRSEQNKGTTVIVDVQV